MNSVNSGNGGSTAAGSSIAASPAHHVSSSSTTSGAGTALAGAGVTDTNSQGSDSVPPSSSTKQPMHISAAASPDQLPRVARKQNRHRHGLGAAPSSAVSEPPLGLADSSVFTRASMSDLLHGPDSGGSSNGNISHGGRAGRGMSSDPFYIAPTRELLLSQYMVGDKQYQDFLLYGKEYKDDNLPGYDCGGVRLTPQSAAKMCAGWSAVGMIFMLWAGLMIQCQPLYLKGIDYNSGFVKRSSGGGNNVNTYNINGNYAGEQVQNQQQTNDQQQQYNNYAGQVGGSGRRPIRPQASNAFKAAAAYFVTMVFSLICYHNHEQMGDLTTAVLPRWRVLLNVRQNCIVAYHQYRRRHYTDIPDTPSKGAGGRRRWRKKKGGEDGELPLFQSASSETTRRRRVGGGSGGPGSGSGSGFSGPDDGDDSDVGSLPLYSSSGVNNNNNAAENFTRELWNKVKGGMRSPLSRRRGRDNKTKHV